MRRRDLIFGATCVAAAGVSYGLKPRKRLNLMGQRKMVDAVPMAFGSWTAQNDDGLVKPELAGKLASQLYNEIVERVYTDRDTGDEVMMLIAYGDTQSDLLQLHRPETCYPAVGFRIVSSQPANLPLKAGVALPGRRVVAQKADREEKMFYWTRLGEYLPTSAGDQRKARLLTAMHGFVSDGGLFRFSALGEQQAAFASLDRFIAGLIASAAEPVRPGLITTRLAGQFDAA